MGLGGNKIRIQRKSAIHWDIVKDLRQEGQVYLDDELIFENGNMLI